MEVSDRGEGLFGNSRARPGNSAIACRRIPARNLEPVSSREILSLVLARYCPAIFPMRSPTQIHPQSELLFPTTAPLQPPVIGIWNRCKEPPDISKNAGVFRTAPTTPRRGRACIVSSGFRKRRDPHDANAIQPRVAGTQSPFPLPTSDTKIQSLRCNRRRLRQDAHRKAQFG